MSIPVNAINLQTAVNEAKAKFEHEIELFENYVFSQRWDTEFSSWGTKYNIEFLRVSHNNDKYYKDENGNIVRFMCGTEHWARFIADVKAAGYCIYRKHYHNGYYGTTEIHCYYITKKPLTVAEREIMELVDKWSDPAGPGREQFRGEQL